jgi:hypothetical protein
MRIVLAVVCAALLVILAMGAALYLLAGDFLGAGVFTVLACATGVVLWFAIDYDSSERIDR